MCIKALRQNKQAVDEWQSRIGLEQSVEALSSKENGQFTAKKPTSGKSDSGHSSQGC